LHRYCAHYQWKAINLASLQPVDTVEPVEIGGTELRVSAWILTVFGASRFLIPLDDDAFWLLQPDLTLGVNREVVYIK
jgi:hypothetical protein